MSPFSDPGQFAYWSSHLVPAAFKRQRSSLIGWLSVSPDCDEAKQKRVGIFTHSNSLSPTLLRRVMDAQIILDYAKSYFYAFISKAYAQGWVFGEQYVFPTLRNLLSSHPDITSLFLLLLVLYISLMVLNTASRCSPFPVVFCLPLLSRRMAGPKFDK